MGADRIGVSESWVNSGVLAGLSSLGAAIFRTPFACCVGRGIPVGSLTGDGYGYACATAMLTATVALAPILGFGFWMERGLFTYLHPAAPS